MRHARSEESERAEPHLSWLWRRAGSGPQCRAQHLVEGIGTYPGAQGNVRVRLVKRLGTGGLLWRLSNQRHCAAWCNQEPSVIYAGECQLTFYRCFCQGQGEPEG